MITSRVLDICTFPVLGLWRIRTCMFPKYSINSVSVSVFCKKKILYHIWSAWLSILLIIKSLFNLLALWYVTRLSILCLLVLSPHSPSISPWLSQDLWDSCPYCLRKYSKYRRDTDWPLQYNSWQEEDCSYSRGGAAGQSGLQGGDQAAGWESQPVSVVALPQGPNHNQGTC